ncbi:hypothetical protein HBH56_211940 [Parastagonospora nodorum]|uniref:Uncharacterized protein n=2 Tax=Phaeosphaeria nodorum (strain SN15 / ATCC MYA-4574 / FGSC 10173) TaxID=321614 RepID=Q0U461_PHANO|nr:hypothetical protein SNOG_13453 [Parastagonospora nodorum SN15]KAH3906001.1 hypothetical protein HBH56_211940 [Parastagonospora nodorum]EAT79337.2 hypothetical protein SNOG_13453 [Parastagonospora nodorum SN15]KAH3931299.1 hypothetical protein HBH54_100550 [Parastagonospora nodorum]KAH3960789.1 hypothetical protein HBH51_190230 [Parastagonospora nodorum]KAH3962911.1 hypothetical protein HBH52_222890 [Parastagonospora nodorum]
MTSLREEAALSDFGNSHQRKHNDYSYRLPAAPRIVVPPPTLSTDMPGIVVSSEQMGELDLTFLQELDLNDIIQKNTLLEWSYERRRHAQMLLPWLYLGPMLAARDKEYLQAEGITMVLAIRAQANSMIGALKVSREVCPEVATIEVPSFHGLISRFDQTTKLINTHLARWRQYSLEKTGQAALGKVLVFCESGNEKSAAVVAAYLMETLTDFDHIKAMQVCQAQRFCVNFDDSLKNLLQSYWDILQARRSVAMYNIVTTQETAAGATSNTHLSTGVKPKRTIEHTRDDEDVEMDDGLDPSDALRFAGRDSTPFQNRDD